MLLSIVLAAGPADTLSADATRDFRAKRYAAACRKFEQAGRLAPADGAIHADLALCLAKLGRHEEAVRANLEAVRLGDARTRKNAYFNLGSLFGTITPPDTGECRPIASNVPGCAAAMGACAFEWDSLEDAGIRQSGTFLRVWIPALPEPAGARALPHAGDVTLGWVERPEAGGVGPGNARDRWTLVTHDVNVPGTINVLRSSESSVYSGRAAESAEDPDSTGGAYRFIEQMPGPTDCSVIAVDACRGLVGIWCEEKAEGKRRKAWSEEVVVGAAARP